MKRIRNILVFLTSLLVTGWLAITGQEGLSIPPLRTASMSISPPALPEVKDSPIGHLQTLLEAPEERRSQMLSQHKETSRTFWKRKLNEYGAMDPNEREKKLREAQLHWYLLLILRTPAEDRDTKLLQIPESDRGLIESRLKEWQELPNALQIDIMTHLPALRYFGRLVSLTPEARKKALEEATQDGNRPDMNSPAWENLDSQRRRSMFLAYQKFFTLEEEKRSRVLAKIPMPQRLSIQSRIQQLENLSPELKEKCLVALEKYAEMTRNERILFRVNAERWKQMPATEHAVWKEVVKKWPPLPPIRTRSTPPIPSFKKRPSLPPMPKGMRTEE